MEKEMNERIKEIALQAGGSHYPTVGGKTLEKFAELLVRECAKIATYPQLGDEESYYGNEFAKAIKKHFGVEE
jgi:hypothetical protein